MRTCSKFASSQWTLVQLGFDIPFRKVFAKLNKHVRGYFYEALYDFL